MLPTDPDLATSNLKARENDVKVIISFFFNQHLWIFSINFFARILSDKIEFKLYKQKSNKLAKKEPLGTGEVMSSSFNAIRAVKCDSQQRTAA